jgi:hypothetical protein
MRLFEKYFSYIIPAIYLIIVITCNYLAFYPTNENVIEWLFISLFITLPWSVVSLYFLLGAIHADAGYEIVSFTQIICAFLNLIPIYFVCSSIKKKGSNI